MTVIDLGELFCLFSNCGVSALNTPDLIEEQLRNRLHLTDY